jgi:hypothetical protein
MRRRGKRRKKGRQRTVQLYHAGVVSVYHRETPESTMLVIFSEWGGKERGGFIFPCIFLFFVEFYTIFI